MTNPNDPAFQTHPNTVDPDGLTKREYYAGLAMRGLLSAYAMNTSLGRANFNIIAETSLAMADALIGALNGDKLA